MAKILIIDDDKAVVDSTADMLKSFEFNVITATDGKKGFERYRAELEYLTMQKASRKEKKVA